LSIFHFNVAILWLLFVTAIFLFVDIDIIIIIAPLPPRPP
jgi:hypothetical protein